MYYFIIFYLNFDINIFFSKKQKRWIQFNNPINYNLIKSLEIKFASPWFKYVVLEIEIHVQCFLISLNLDYQLNKSKYYSNFMFVKV